MYRHMLDGIGNPLMYLFNGFSTRNGLGVGINKKLFLEFILWIVLLAGYDLISLERDVITELQSGNVWRRVLAAGGIIIVIILFGAMGETSFVYFQF